LSHYKGLWNVTPYSLLYFARTLHCEEGGSKSFCNTGTSTKPHGVTYHPPLPEPQVSYSIKLDIRFSQKRLFWGVKHVVQRKPDVSEEHIASNFSIYDYIKQEISICFCWSLARLNLRP
jgi:hypothetical protein